MSFIMFILKQHLHLEIAIQKFFNNGYRKHRNLRLANYVNAAKMTGQAENNRTDWQFSVFRALLYTDFLLSVCPSVHYILVSASYLAK